MKQHKSYALYNDAFLLYAFHTFDLASPFVFGNIYSIYNSSNNNSRFGDLFPCCKYLNVALLFSCIVTTAYFEFRQKFPPTFRFKIYCFSRIWTAIEASVITNSSLKKFEFEFGLQTWTYQVLHVWFSNKASRFLHIPFLFNTCHVLIDRITWWPQLLYDDISPV